MREIAARQITDTVERLCIQANCHLPRDVNERPFCQDTGMACVFL